jgi:hypothetical protein
MPSNKNHFEKATYAECVKALQDIDAEKAALRERALLVRARFDVLLAEEEAARKAAAAGQSAPTIRVGR